MRENGAREKCHALSIEFSASMRQEGLAACLRITEEFLERPLNVFFKDPIDSQMDQFPGYMECISKPMDLTTVKSNLERGVYRDTSDWYVDMCLIYENAIKYHTIESPWGLIAQQLLDDFKKVANGFQAQSYMEWGAILAKATSKLGVLIGDSPIKAGQDSLVQACVKRGETMGKFPHETIGDVMERMKVLFENPACRRDFLTIVQSGQKKDTPIVMNDNNEAVVDVEKLKDQVLHALTLYVKAMAEPM